jgi:hypothetical protein
MQLVEMELVESNDVEGKRIYFFLLVEPLEGIHEESLEELKGWRAMIEDKKTRRFIVFQVLLRICGKTKTKKEGITCKNGQ